MCDIWRQPTNFLVTLEPTYMYLHPIILMADFREYINKFYSLLYSTILQYWRSYRNKQFIFLVATLHIFFSSRTDVKCYKRFRKNTGNTFSDSLTKAMNPQCSLPSIIGADCIVRQLDFLRDSIVKTKLLSISFWHRPPIAWIHLKL